MLVLSRRLNESIIIDGNIRITVVGLRGNQVRLGVEAPGSVPILREELCPSPGPGRAPRAHAARTALAVPDSPPRPD